MAPASWPLLYPGPSGVAAHQVQQGILVVATGVSLRTGETGSHKRYLPAAVITTVLLLGARPGTSLCSSYAAGPHDASCLSLFAIWGYFFVSPFDSLTNYQAASCRK